MKLFGKILIGTAVGALATGIAVNAGCSVVKKVNKTKEKMKKDSK